MAKVTMPLLSGEARGKMDGLIYNSWRGIATVKKFAAPTNPQTEAQIAVRSILSTASRAWSSLSDIQRDTWSAYADSHLRSDWTGRPKRITAQNWFVSCNSRLLQQEKSLISDPPAVPGPASIEGFVVSPGVSPDVGVDIKWTAPTTSAESIAIYVAGPMSHGRRPVIQQAAIRIITPGTNYLSVALTDIVAPGRYGFWASVWSASTGLAAIPVLYTLDIS